MSTFFDELVVPTHPEYDWGTDPGEQAEYVNPVTLNNYEIRWANAAIRVTQRLVVANKKIAGFKDELQGAKDALDDFEQDLLRDHPAPSGATKSLKLLDAYLSKTAFDQGQAQQYKDLVGTIRTFRRKLQLAEVDAENCHHVYQTLKLAGEHAMTHLSFVKHDFQSTRHGT